MMMMMMMMRASPVIQAPKLGVLQREVFPITSYFQFPGYQANRTYGVRICYPRQLRFCQSESVESVVDESLNFKTVPQSICLAENEEAKVVLTPNSKKLRPEKFGAMARVSEMGSDGHPYSVVPYLLDLGLDMDQIRAITRSQPDFADYSLEGKVEPVVEFLLVLGVNQADIDTILSRRPELRTISLTEKLIPTMIYLECLGVDKKKWAKVIYRSPGLLTYSRQKLKTTVEFFYELGLKVESVGKILTRYPRILDLSVEENLRPKAQYFSSLGVDIAHLVYHAPQVFGLSLTENIIPTMTYLESLGVDKKKWAKVIYRCPSLLTYSRQKLKATVDFFYELGLTVESVGKILTGCPPIVDLSVEENLRPTAQYFRSLGVDIAHLVCHAPEVFGLSVTKNIIPTMTYLESLGVDKKKWAKVIYRSPSLLKYSRQKLKATVDFFYELGLTVESVGKILTRWPRMVDLSVEENLRPTAEYFSSVGVDVAVLVCQAPQVFSSSIQRKLMPVTEFFLEKGYTTEEVGTMLSRYGSLFSYSLLTNIIPKWEFFLTMDYPMSELVKFPQYFGYSLEERIKPRYAMMRESGVKMYLNQVLTVAEPVFEATLRRRVKKKLDGFVGSNVEGFNLNIPNLQIETTL